MEGIFRQWLMTSDLLPKSQRNFTNILAANRPTESLIGKIMNKMLLLNLTSCWWTKSSWAGASRDGGSWSYCWPTFIQPCQRLVACPSTGYLFRILVVLSFGTFMTNSRAPVAVETGVNHGQLVVKNPVCNKLIRLHFVKRENLD